MDNGKKEFMEKYLTPIAVLVGALIIAGVLLFGSGGMGKQGEDQQAVDVDIKDVKTEGSPFIGNANAPVTMAFWFDYQCPFCKQFDETITPQLYTEYVQTGKLKIVFKDFQFLGQYSQIPGRDDSTTAALFARAMWEAYPDKFYEWYQAMAAAQDAENGGFGDAATIQALTAKIEGVDAARVAKLVTDNKAKYQAAISADRSEGQSMGISGTPAYIIGKTSLSGVHPYTEIKGLIDAELK